MSQSLNSGKPFIHSQLASTVTCCSLKYFFAFCVINLYITTSNKNNFKYTIIKFKIASFKK